MKNKKISLMIVGGISAVIFVVFSMFIYVNYVQDSLWDKSINDILETTSQEEKAFNVYMTKEMTNSQNILTNIAYLQTKIRSISSIYLIVKKLNIYISTIPMTATMMKMVIIR